ncbi:MAG: transglycosylase SLT domain-containing protein [Methylococcales bacterium]|jgi:hypothetical protein|nr:transglycosylase SLT domain-containing protein [Methylococcales bacterium]MBT7445954.1 transglycosylase SLT domain-containing protein [Methylococcales bacterium]
MLRLAICIISALALSSCSSPPTKIHNVCDIFEEKPDWFDATEATEQQWGTPIHVQMAIIRQESAFKSEARPPRETLFGFIPWFRPSTAFGYAQVLDGTWEWYQKKTGNTGADRDDFDDASDFVGWYTKVSQTKLKIPLSNAGKQYLAYHEGHGGYARKTYRKKPWLVKVSKKVARYSNDYQKQLKQCRPSLEARWSLWPF